MLENPKKLILIRHAKSDWSKDVSDFERPLNERGIKEAPLVAQELLNHGLVPEFIISSSANRAKSTAILMANEWKMDVNEISFDKNAYHATPENLLKIINQAPRRFNTISLFGHNPGISMFASKICNESFELKTSCAIVLNMHVESWNLISYNTCSMQIYISPKDLY